MDGTLVKSFNLFLDSDMPHDIGTSTGDSFDVHMNDVNIDSAQGQFIRLTLTSFSMFKNFPNINQYNSKFVVRSNGKPQVCDLDHTNYQYYGELMNDFAIQVERALKANDNTNAANINLVTNSTKPATNIGPSHSTTRIGEFEVNYPSHPNVNEIKVQFYEHYDTTGNENSDIYALLGGDRIRKTYDAADAADASPSSINVTSVNADKLKFTCKYPMQLYTEQFVYLHCDSFQGNNMESTSLRPFDGSVGSQSKVCDLHHSHILGRIPIQNEFIHYDAQSEREFFVDLPTNLNHLNYAKFRLTGSHGRNLHSSANQSTLGNLNFSMVIRCDVIQKFNPNQPFTKEKERSVPPRYSNVQTDYNGHIR
jgi:hypothetical protein